MDRLILTHESQSANLKGKGPAAHHGPFASHSEPPPVVPDSTRRAFFILLGLSLIATAFLFNTPKDVFAGSLKILLSPANLLTDYFELANIGATLLNAGLMTLVSICMVCLNQTPVTGSIAAAIFTVAGFSFFGKNLYNSIPIVLGVYLYSRLVRQPYNRFLIQSLFGTALGPLVSLVTFAIGIRQPFGILLGMGCGVLAGFLLPPLSAHFLRFHQGFNLYNIGFTTGIIATIFIAVLRGFGIEVATVSIVSTGNNKSLSIMLFSLFAAMLLLGLAYNRMGLRGYRHLLNQSGKLASDFTVIAGPGITLLNMSLLGILSTTYVLLLGGQINGPIIGGIFTVVGFGAFGKHLRNVIPIFAGILLANLFNIYDPHSTTGLVSTLFGTTLAPIAGYYGAGYGILAGFLHMALVTNISYLHGGINLYNNGFSGGFVAAALVPVIDMISQVLTERRQERAAAANRRPDQEKESQDRT